MKEEQLDKLVNEFYESTQLTDSKIEHILKNTPEKEISFPFYRKAWFSYAAAACIAFMIVSVVVSNVVNRVNYEDQSEVATQIISIYDRHITPEVYSSDLQSIATGLSHSEFSIIPTNMEVLGNYKILGGRNCGLKGLKAVHVMLLNETSQVECCLYILPDVESFKRFKNALVDVGDTNHALDHIPVPH